MNRRKLITGALASGAALVLPKAASASDQVTVLGNTWQKRETTNEMIANADRLWQATKSDWRLHLNLFLTFYGGKTLHVLDEHGNLFLVVRELGQVRDARDFGYRFVGEGAYKWASVTAVEAHTQPDHVIQIATKRVENELLKRNIDWSKMTFKAFDEEPFLFRKFDNAVYHAGSDTVGYMTGQQYKAEQIVSTGADYGFFVSVYDFDVTPTNSLYIRTEANFEDLKRQGLTVRDYQQNIADFAEVELPFHYNQWKRDPDNYDLAWESTTRFLHLIRQPRR